MVDDHVVLAFKWKKKAPAAHDFKDSTTVYANYTHTWTQMRGQPFKHWSVPAWGTVKVKNTLHWLLVYTSYNSGLTAGIHKCGTPEVLQHEEAETCSSVTLMTCASLLSLSITHTHTNALQCVIPITLTLIFSTVLLHYVQMGCQHLSKKKKHMKGMVSLLTYVDIYFINESLDYDLQT